ncbi:MAG: hypothetical protein KDK99_16225, partial [Verrucomicrobiales bacterium]|nr:hypothetical protein [Verrucomicrobiales bacterium]
MPRLSPRFCLRLSLALVSGATLTLAYPRWNWEPAVWIGLVPLLALLWPADLDRPSPRRPFAWGWIAGLAFFLPNLAWVRHSSRVIHGAQGSEWMG